MSHKIRLQRIQRFITRMPSLSTTVTKILEICNNPEASPSDLNRAISYDPVLSGQLLKLINSAYYGFANRINSLTRAIIMLGINTVKHMALTTSILTCLKGQRLSDKMNIDTFWEHSLCVAVIAKAIAKERQVHASELEGYFLAGLMHDLGKIPMMATCPERYIQAMSSSETEGLPICDSERLHLGMDHCQVGRLIVTKWQLSHDMLQAIGNHHQILSQGENPTMQWLYTALANQLANKLSEKAVGESEKDATLFNDLMVQFGSPVQGLEQLESHIAQEIKKAKIFMQIAVEG